MRRKVEHNDLLQPDNLNWKQVGKRWAENKQVWSVELGGIGPGYEQCIQLIIFEVLSRAPSDWFAEKPADSSYPKNFDQLFGEIVDELNKKFGFSGAQVATAKLTTWQFMFYGYAEQMAKAPQDRKILVQRDFPCLLKFGKPTPEQINDVFNSEKLLSEIKRKIPKGKGILPEDMVPFARIIFETGVLKGIEFCEEKANGNLN